MAAPVRFSVLANGNLVWRSAWVDEPGQLQQVLETVMHCCLDDKYGVPLLSRTLQACSVDVQIVPD